MIEKRRGLFTLLAFFLVFSVAGQNFTRNNWYFTNSNASLTFAKFNDNEPILVQDGQSLNQAGEKLTVNDPTTGDLLFYTDGVNIYDATHDIMANAVPLTSDPNGIQAQSASPVPGTNGERYYLFVRTTTGEINFTVIDMTAQGNRPNGSPVGEVAGLSMNIPTGITDRGDGMITIGSRDMTEFWLLTQDSNTGLIELISIPEQGQPFTVEGNLNLTAPAEAMHFSYHPQTGQIAMVPANNTNIQVLQFTNGGISGTTVVSVRSILNSFQPGETFGGSAGWSITGNFLYFSRNSGTAGQLYRFDMFDDRDEATFEAVFENTLDESLSLLTGSDSSVYHLYREGGTRLLARINQPDSALNNLEYEAGLFDNQPFESNYFTQFTPEAELTPEVTAVIQNGQICMNNPIQFYPIISPSTAIPTSFTWDFQPSGNMSNLQSPIQTFEQEGVLMATLSVEINGLTFTDMVNAQIQPNDLQVSLSDTTICPGETLNLDAEPQQNGQGQGPGVGGGGGPTGGPFEYLWNTGETTSSIDVTEAGNYWVVVTPSDGCPVYATARVQVYGEENRTANIWYFGNGAGIDFNEEEGLDPPPRSITEAHAMDAPEGTSTISDANGDVLFYSDGETVWNRENEEMPNGTELGGDNVSAQSVLIVPFVDDETLYYVFTTQEVYGENTFELKYSVVDMKEDDGKGDVILKDVVLYSRSTERLASIEGDEGSWLISHEYGNNTFRTYGITAEGITAPILSSAGAVHSFNDPLNGQGGMKFSSDGERVAVALIEGSSDFVEVFDFEPLTGRILEMEFRLDLNEGEDLNDEVYDVHFSQGGVKLFASLNNRNGGTARGRIIEYRVDSLSTQESRLASKTNITANSNLNVNIGQIQTGPDGNLYVAVEVPGNPGATNFVSSISAVDDTLQTSVFSPQIVALTTGNSRLGLPNFVQNSADPQQEPSLNAPPLVCVEDEVPLTGTGTSDIDEFAWTITNQDDNSTVFTAAVMDTSYVFPQGQNGIFNISLNITNRCGLDTTLLQEIEVQDIPPQPTVPQAIALCEGDTQTLDAIAGEPDNPILSFEWTDSQGNVVSTTRNFTVTQQEIYTVVISNTAGCTNSASVFVGPPFEISLPETSVICQDSELTLDPNVTADNYIWTVIASDNATQTLPNQRRATVDSSVPGTFTYVVSIEDPISMGCFVNDTTMVTINPIAQGLISNVVNTACGASDGGFDFEITTTGNYSYIVSGNNAGVVDESTNFDGPGTVSVSSLAADIYSVEITDNSSGCVNTLSDIQVQNDPPDFTITNVVPTDADCDVSTGSINVTLSDNIFPITYTLTNTTTGNTITNTVNSATPMTSFDFEVANLPGGTYNLEVVSTGGCSQSQTGIQIVQPLPVDLTTEPFVEICGAAAPLSASSSTAGTSFSWSGPNGFSDNGANTNAPESGTYTVTATAPGACPVTEEVVVDLTIEPIVQITQEGDVCEGNITLIAEVTNPEADANYSFLWSTGATADRITVDASADYSVTARNAANITCSGQASINITIPDEIEATVSSSPACDDGSPITLTVNVTAGNPTNFNWTRDGQSAGQGATLVVQQEGTYVVNISDASCFIERSFNVRRQRIPEGQLPEVDFYCSTRSNNPILLAGSGFVTYEWTRDGQPFPQGGQNLVVDAPGEYVVTMTTATGCIQTDSVRIIESCDPRVIAPNAFSPDSDPPNDGFSVFPNDFVSDFEIFIYNRWGELIFQSSTLEFKWDGTFEGQLVPLGTYPYVIRFKSRFEPERGIFEQRGAVTVIR